MPLFFKLQQFSYNLLTLFCGFFDKKPDFIVEIGTAFCGSALYFADMMDINKKGHVISIDISPRGPLIPHDRITYLNGDSKSPEIIKKIKENQGKAYLVKRVLDLVKSLKKGL